MSKHTIIGPQIEEETAGRLVVTPKNAVRFQAVTILLILLIGGLGLAFFGWLSDISCLAAAGAPLFLIGILLTARNPVFIRLTLDDTRRQLTVEQTRLIPLGFVPRRQLATFNLEQVKSIEATENMLSTAFGVKMRVGSDTTIVLQTRKDRDLARSLYVKLASFLDLASDQEPVREAGLPGSEFGTGDAIGGPLEDRDVPVAGWRLGLAAVFGLLVALVGAWIWYLIAKATDTRFGLIALLIGFTVGLAVSLTSGGSRDAVYGLLGAGLAAVGVVIGEILIFGNLELGYQYEFDVLTILIYVLAVWEGWIIPRRSMRLVRENSQRINENNWQPLLIAGLGLILIVLVIGVVAAIVPLPGELLASYHAQAVYRHLAEGDLSAAEAKLNEALGAQPDWTMGNILLGDIHREKQRFPEAESAYLLALESEPDQALANFGLAVTYAVLGRRDEALVHVERAKRSEMPDGRAHLLSGELLFFQEQWQDSKADVSTALQMGLEENQTAYARLLQGYALINMAQFQDALAIAERMIADDPGNAYAHLMRGEANFKLGNKEAGVSDLEMALTLGLDPEAEQGARFLLSQLE